MPSAASARALLRLLALVVPGLAVAACGGAGEGEPAWIWRDHDLRHVEATSFYAVREVELPPPSGELRARIVGDEEYVLYVNRARVGSGRVSRPGVADELDLSRALRPGRNRIVVELRSSTGAGGFWFELRDGAARRLVSDRSWTIYREDWHGLLRDGALAPGERPQVLGVGAVGRWGRVARTRELPAFDSVLASDEPTPAALFRTWGSAGEWSPLAPRKRRGASLGPLVEIDFGEVVTGYLQLASRVQEGSVPGPALIRFGVDPLPAPPAEADVVFRPLPGRELHQDAVARRFRYVAVGGLAGLFAADVLAVRPEALSRLDPDAAERSAARGVFGVKPPPLSAPVEHEVWRELERATGLVLRKDR